MQHLCLLAKHWTPGKVKTRLASSIGEAEAADIFREFVLTLLDRLSQVGDVRTIACSPPDKRQDFSKIVGTSWVVEPQSAGGLGERMQALFVGKITEEDDCCILLGCDSPNVPVEHVKRAFELLEKARLVLGPTNDGGYYLIGARGEVPPVLIDMPYSTPGLWAATMERLAQLGWREGTDYAVLPPWYDVDTAADLARLQGDLADIPSIDTHLEKLAERLSPF